LVGAGGSGTPGVVIPSWRRCREASASLVVWSGALRAKAQATVLPEQATLAIVSSISHRRRCLGGLTFVAIAQAPLLLCLVGSVGGCRGSGLEWMVLVCRGGGLGNHGGLQFHGVNLLLAWLGWQSCVASAARLSARSTRLSGDGLTFRPGRRPWSASGLPCAAWVVGG
jgi:hypothetical protein